MLTLMIIGLFFVGLGIIIIWQADRIQNEIENSNKILFEILKHLSNKKDGE